MLVDILCRVVCVAVAIAIPSEIRAAPALAKSFMLTFSTVLIPTFTGHDTLLQTLVTVSKSLGGARRRNRPLRLQKPESV